MFDFSQLINDVIVWAGFIGLSKTPLIQFVAKNKSAIETVAKDAESVIEDVVKIPAAKVMEEKLKHEFNDMAKQFRDSEVGRVVTASLNAFSETLDQLTEDQKNSIEMNAVAILKEKFLDITQEEVIKALNEAQKVSDEIAKSPIIEIGNKFAAEKKKLQAPVQQQA